MNYKNTISAIIISALYIPIWGLTFLSIDTASIYTVFAGMLFSFYSIAYLKNISFVKKTKYSKIILLIFPALYLILSLVVFKKNIAYILSPILWAFIILLISLKYLDKISFRNLTFTILFSGLYAYYIYPIFRYPPQELTFDGEEIEKKDLQLSKSLQSYSFIKNEKDTIQIISGNKLILVETWNETCLPCLAAMNDLQPLMESLSGSIKHYYLYENGTKNGAYTNSKIFNFPRIVDKSKIISDINSRFLLDSKMTSYPYFLLFDKRGNLIDYFKGYNPKFKDYFVKRLKGMSSKIG